MGPIFSRFKRADARPEAHFAIPAAFLALLLIGAARAYTPVPTYDMWEGAIVPAFQMLDGDGREVLRFWNEHRIVFSKILFWIDTGFFGARLAFLIVANILLAVGLWLVLCAAARPLIDEKGLRRIVCAGIAALSFSWMQRENIDSPFQSQFLLAFLVPLAAFLSLANSARGPRSDLWFAAAVALGAAALGTMANGLLVFPLLVAMQLALDAAAGRMSWRRLGLLVATAGILTFAWFQDFPGPGAGPPSPAAFLTFAATYLAFPAAALGGIAGGILGTFAFLAILSWVLSRWVAARRAPAPHAIALLTMILYVGATCLMTAYGRAADLGNAALVSRYATPSLLAWAALAILAAAAYQHHRGARSRIAAASLLIAAPLFALQVSGATGDGGPAFVHGTMRGALALKLGVADVRAMAEIFPAPTPAHYGLLKDLADRLEARGLSTFADPAWDEAIARLGAGADGRGRACGARIEAVRDIAGDGRFKAVQGWVDDPPRGHPGFVYLIADGRIVGLAVGGGPRPDVARYHGRKARYGGFAGYAFAAAAGGLSVRCAGD